MFDVIQNRRVIYGPGTVQQLPQLAGSMTDKTVFVMAYHKIAPSVAAAVEAMRTAGRRVVLDTSVRAEPTVDDVDRVAALAVESGAGVVVAVGGGSVLDSAKAVAMLATNGGTVEQYQMEGKPIRVPALPIVSVPTTAGTGSEATKTSVVYNPKNRLKKSFYGLTMIADTVILDPELTVPLSRAATVSTGIDALSHAVESYVSRNATPYTEMFGLKAMRLILKSLETCVDEPGNLEARGDMLLASYFAGCALNAGIGFAHIIAQPLGGLCKIPHGVACAIYLPMAMEYNLEYCTDKYCDIARIFGETGENGMELARRGVARVEEYLKRLGAPDSIRSYLPENFDLEDAVDLVQGATGHIKVNPRPVTREALREAIARSIR